MGEITDLIQSYRECVQQVWNCHFRDLPGGWHEFGDVEDALLYGIVLAQADEYKNWRDESAAKLYPSIRVVPRLGTNGIEGMWAREQKGGNWRWSPVQITDEMNLFAFTGDFEWHVIDGNLDYQYIRCRILRSAEHPQLVGADLLLPVLEVGVYHDMGAERISPNHRRR